MIIEQQLATRKPSHAPGVLSNTNMESLVEYIDTLPYTEGKLGLFFLGPGPDSIVGSSF
jgi:hypothetical protein